MAGNPFDFLPALDDDAAVAFQPQVEADELPSTAAVIATKVVAVPSEPPPELKQMLERIRNGVQPKTLARRGEW